MLPSIDKLFVTSGMNLGDNIFFSFLSFNEKWEKSSTWLLLRLNRISNTQVSHFVEKKTYFWLPHGILFEYITEVYFLLFKLSIYQELKTIFSRSADEFWKFMYFPPWNWINTDSLYYEIYFKLRFMALIKYMVEQFNWNCVVFFFLFLSRWKALKGSFL